MMKNAERRCTYIINKQPWAWRASLFLSHSDKREGGGCWVALSLLHKDANFYPLSSIRNASRALPSSRESSPDKTQIRRSVISFARTSPSQVGVLHWQDSPSRSSSDVTWRWNYTAAQKRLRARPGYNRYISANTRIDERAGPSVDRSYSTGPPDIDASVKILLPSFNRLYRGHLHQQNLA